MKNLKQYENFDFDEDDFDFEEFDSNWDSFKIIDLYNQCGSDIDNMVDEMNKNLLGKTIQIYDQYNNTVYGPIKVEYMKKMLSISNNQVLNLIKDKLDYGIILMNKNNKGVYIFDSIKVL